MTAGSPIAAILSSLMGPSAGSPGGGAPSPGGAPAAAPPLGMQVSQQLADLQGADPAGLIRQLQNWKSGAAALIPHTAFRIPKMAPHLAAILKGIDKAIEAAAEAQTTAATVGAANPPLGMSAAGPLDQQQQGGGGIF